MFDFHELIPDFSLYNFTHKHLAVSIVLAITLFIIIGVFGDFLYSILFLCLAIQLAQHKRIRNLEDKDT